MSTYNINLPAATSFGITNVYIQPPTQPPQNDTPPKLVTVNVTNPDDGFSFVHSVLQTLQDVIAANQTTDATTSNPIGALQTFLYDLNQALTTNPQQDTNPALTSDDSTVPALTTDSSVTIAYSNPASNLQNLISSLDNGSDQSNTLKTDFSTLVQSMGGSSINLQDFLQQLSTNINGDFLPESKVGNLFEATA